MTSNVLPLHFAPSQASSSENSIVDNMLEGYKIKSALPFQIFSTLTWQNDVGPFWDPQDISRMFLHEINPKLQHFWLISLLPVLQITIRKILTHTFAPPRYPVKRHQHNFFQVNHKKGGFFFYV